MVDANLLVRDYLLTQTPVTALLGTNANSSIYCGYDLPEHFDPKLGPAIQIFRSGGLSHPEITPLVDARVHIRVWADVEKPFLASRAYAAINDALHGVTGITLADGTIVRALEVTAPQEMTDPETGWVAVFAFYAVMARPNGSSPLTPPSGDILMPSLTYHKVAAATNNAANIKPTPGTVTGWKIYNKAGYPIYVKLFNKATTPIPGTDTPQQTIGVDAGLSDLITSAGYTYTNGIGIAIVQGILDNDNTSVAAADCVVDIFYQ